MQSRLTTHAARGISWTESTVSAEPIDSVIGSRRATTATGVADSVAKIGSSSLAEIAIRSFLANVDTIDANTLLGLPHTLGKALWRRVEEQNLTTTTIWTAFCRAFPEEETFQYYTASDINPQRTMEGYISLLNSRRRDSTHFDWLTALTISNLTPSRSDILSVSKIPNLVALDLYHLDPSHEGAPDDRLLRAWAEHARETEAFAHLQVLIIREQKHITAKSFQQLPSVPKLVLFGVQNCGVSASDEAEARTLGWTTNDEFDILRNVQRDIEFAHSSHGILYGCVRRSRCLLPETQGVSVRNYETPLLSYRVGMSRSSSTISNPAGNSTPLLFFRNLAHGVRYAPPTVTLASKQMWPHEAGPKRRKLTKGAMRKGAEAEMLLEMEWGGTRSAQMEQRRGKVA